MIGATPATLTRSLCTTPKRDARGHACVDGVAARLQDREARLRSQVVPGDDGVPMAADHRPERVDRLGVERRVFASASAHGYSWLAR